MWCRFDFETAGHLKTKALAEALNIPVYAACGLLALLWSWSIDRAVGDKGSINDYSVRAIEAACCWNGERGELLRALIRCGWLDGEPDSEKDPLRIHDWMDFNGPLLDRRAKDRERKRRQRERKNRPATFDGPDSESCPTGQSRGTVQGATVNRLRSTVNCEKEHQQEVSSSSLASRDVSDADLVDAFCNTFPHANLSQQALDELHGLGFENPAILGLIRLVEANGPESTVPYLLKVARQKAEQGFLTANAIDEAEARRAKARSGVSSLGSTNPNDYAAPEDYY